MYIHFSRRDLYTNLMKNIPKLTCTYNTEDEPAMKMSGAILYDLTSEPHTIKVNDKIPTDINSSYLESKANKQKV